MVALSEVVTERVLNLETVKARVLEAGNGEPTIFLHQVGVTSGAETWLPAIHVGLGENLRVIAIDNLGWGPIERPVINYAFPYWVDHIREIQDALGLTRTNIVGHSLGGWIGAVFAYESPERVNKLVLVANAGMNANPPAAVTNFSLPDKERLRASTQLEDPAMTELVTEERWRNVTVPNAEEAFSKISTHLQDNDMRRRYHLKRRLPHIKAPTLIIYGENDPNYPPDPMGKEIASLIPDSRFEVLKDTAHGVPLERPREMTALIKDFLK